MSLGPAVTIVESGGIPVRQVDSGAPAITAVESGGVAVTLSDNGPAFVIEGSGGGASAPGAISDLTATALGSDSIQLAYTDATGATSHEYRVNGGMAFAMPGDKIVIELQSDTPYLFEVRGVNDEGPGSWSNAVEEATDPAATMSLATPISVTALGSGLNTGSTRYAPPVGSIASSVFGTSAAQARTAISRDGVLSKFSVRMPTVIEQGSWTWTLMKNGVDTAMSAVVDTTSGDTVIDLSNTVDVEAGNDICVKIVPTGTPTAQTGPVQFAFTFTGTEEGESVMFGYYSASAATGYTSFGGNQAPAVTEAEASNCIPPNCSGTMTQFSVHLNAAPGTGNTRTYTIRRNGVDTDLTVTLSDSETDKTIPGQNVTWAAGDLLSIAVSATGTPPTTSCGYGVDWLPGINGNVPIYSRFGSLSASAERFAPLGGYSTSGATTAQDAGNLLPIDLSVYNFFVGLSVAPGSGKSRNFKITENAVDTAVSITIANSETTGTDITNVLTSSQFDRLAVHSTPISSPGVPTWVRLSAVLQAGEAVIEPPSNLAPTNITLSDTSFSDTATVGQTLAVISVTDPDVGDTHTLTLLDDASGKYSIVGNELRCAATLTPGTDTIEIEAEDSGSLTYTKTFGLTVAASAGDYDVDAAEAELEAAFLGLWEGLADEVSWDTETTVTSATALQNALIAARSTASSSIAITRKHKIVCDWDGVSSHTAAISAAGYQARTDGHLDNGGGIYVVNAPGATPSVGNMVNFLGVRGIHWHGVGLMNQWSGSGPAETQYGAQTQWTSTWPARPVVLIEDALFGIENLSPGTAESQYIGGFNTSGVADDIWLKDCTFKGVQNAVKCKSKFTRATDCDFQLCAQDCFDVFGHTSTTETDYYAYVMLDRMTFRNAIDGISNRNNHMDMAQTGTSLDRHLGYRLLCRDWVGHLNHSYAGDPGQGGGSQGCYNDDHLTADNQFVMRRCIVLPSAPSGFAFWSPEATKPSFIDQCTFNRCGQVPSNLVGDVNAAQDFSSGINAGSDGALAGASLGTSLYVTKTIDGLGQSLAWLSLDAVLCDPRNTSIVAAPSRPETIFKGGAGFLRGEHIAGKLSYYVPDETGTRAQFVAGVWSLFEPNDTLQGLGYGCPDPTGLF